MSETNLIGIIKEITGETRDRGHAIELILFFTWKGTRAVELKGRTRCFILLQKELRGCHILFHWLQGTKEKNGILLLSTVLLSDRIRNCCVVGLWCGEKIVLRIDMVPCQNSSDDGVCQYRIFIIGTYLSLNKFHRSILSWGLSWLLLSKLRFPLLFCIFVPSFCLYNRGYILDYLAGYLVLSENFGEEYSSW